MWHFLLARDYPVTFLVILWLILSSREYPAVWLVRLQNPAASLVKPVGVGCSVTSFLIMIGYSGWVLLPAIQGIASIFCWWFVIAGYISVMVLFSRFRWAINRANRIVLFFRFLYYNLLSVHSYYVLGDFSPSNDRSLRSLGIWMLMRGLPRTIDHWGN